MAPIKLSDELLQRLNSEDTGCAVYEDGSIKYLLDMPVESRLKRLWHNMIDTLTLFIRR